MPTGVYPRQKVAPCDRVLAKVEVHPLGCWIFTGALTESGYGKVNVDRIPRLVHRVVYEEMVGVIPEGLTLDHLCGTCACVNPSHLEPVTAAENTRRQWAAERANAGVRQRERTHCPHGHPYSLENTYVKPSGERCCRTCRRSA